MHARAQTHAVDTNHTHSNQHETGEGNVLTHALTVQLCLLHFHKDTAIDVKIHLIYHASFNRHKNTAAVLSNCH